MYLFIKKNFLLKLILSSLIFSAFSNVGFSQESSSNSNTNQAAESGTPIPAVTPVPLADVVVQAEETSARLAKIREGLDQSPGVDVIVSELPNLQAELDTRVDETTNLLSNNPSLETLRTIEQDWRALSKNIPVWKEDLKTQIAVYENYLQELNNLRELWQQTLDSLTKFERENNVNTNVQSDSNNENSNTINANSNINTGKNLLRKEAVPPEILEKIRQELNLIEATYKQVEEKRSQLLALQARVSKQEKRINEMINSIKQVREDALSHLLVKDSPAIWNAHRKTDSISQLTTETSDSLLQQVVSLGQYAKRQSDKFILHAIIFLFLTGLLFWLRRRMKPWVEEEPKLERAFTVFRLPLVSALILTIMLSGWFYPQAPRILSAILGALALIPGVLFLRQVLERPFFPILNALMVFYLIDQIRLITATLPVITRFLFLFEILGAILFLVWFLRSKRLSSKIPVIHHQIFATIKKAIPVMLVLFSAAFIANVFGYGSLSNVIGNGVLGSAYIALILYTTTMIIESLLVFAFRIRPLSFLNMVKEHRDMLQRNVFRIIKWIAVIIWILLTLDLFSIRETLYTYIKGYLTAELVVGSIAISLSDVIIFGITVWLAFALSRFIRFVLAEDVYTRVHLAGGVPYAISTVLHYVILVGGFVLAIAALGIDLTKFTILAGAFGVGLGFGLQNIVNNFVSGLILLFERPVKVNDVVQIGTHQGDLKQIGLRASVLRTLDGAEVIVPNGQLISEEVINWTFSDKQRRLEINVGVAYGNKPREIIEMLTKVAIDNDEIMEDPAPRTIFVGFGDNSLDFQLRAWTERSSWVVIKSDLTLAVHDVLEQNNIEIPFPQRDLHLRTVDKEIADKLENKSNQSK